MSWRSQQAMSSVFHLQWQRLLVTTVLLLTVLFVVPAARADFHFGDFKYTNSDAGCIITGYTGPGGVVSIPSVISNRSVVAIGANAFKTSSVVSVTIPDSVTKVLDFAFYSSPKLTQLSIGTNAASFGNFCFYGCSNLSSVFIPNGNASLGDYCFYGCSKLASATLGTGGSGIASIGLYGFAYCVNLSTLNILSGGANIKDYAFSPCLKLTNATIGNAISAAGPVGANVGNYVFYNDTGLTDVSFGNSVTNVGNYSFSGCSALRSLTFGKAVRSLGAYCFSECSRLSSVSFPIGFTALSSYSFSGCSNLTDVVIGSHVSVIQDGVFNSCSQLARVIIPASVTNIGSFAFADCRKLTEIFFTGNPPRTLGTTPFANVSSGTVYYLPGASNWSNTLAGRPATLWNPTLEVIGTPLGVQANTFRMIISGNSNIPIVLEASANLSSASWLVLKSLSLTNGTFNYVDLQYPAYSSRFYRVRSP